MHFYSIHVIAEYIVLGSEIIGRQIVVAVTECSKHGLISIPQ